MSRRFKKPTHEEVAAYARSIGFDLDGEAFCDLYESKGWMVGSSPMKDWKAAVRTWKRNRNKWGHPPNETPGGIAEMKRLEDAVETVRSYRERIRLGFQTPCGEDPRDALRRYWIKLEDACGRDFVEKTKARLKG